MDECGLEMDKSDENKKMQLPVDWIEERFRVDRRKLEEMILGKPVITVAFIIWSVSFLTVSGAS